MKKGLLALGSSLTICLSMLATDMVVKQKNGEDWKINVDDVEEVFFEEKANIPDDSTVVDTSETFLRFNILSDSTAEVIRDDSGDDRSYFGHDSITIPEKVRIDGKIYTVTSIGAGAFQLCLSLTSIVIPESVTNIGAGAFTGCDSLDSKLLVYDKGTKCYGWIGDTKKCTEVVIPESVTNIGAGAFQDCINLASISIPEGVTSIGAFVFYGCINLTNINIPNGVTSIGEWAFCRCSNLTSIKIPESVTSIEVKTFFACSSLKHIEIPESVTSIETSAFGDCNSLKSINVATNNPMYSSENGVLYNKNKTVVIYIPKEIEPQLLIYDNGTKCYGWIGDKNKCTDVVIPESVTSIETKAFFDCSNLTNINIPKGVTSIGANAFYRCNNLTSISIPESVTNIGNSAFYNCEKLDVVIDNSEKNVEVGSHAFYTCKSVKWLKE